MKFPFLRKVCSVLLASSVLVMMGAGCGEGETPQNASDVELTYWRVFDGDDAFDDIIDAYQAQHPYVNIEYRVLRFDEYEEELMRALAKGEGPDIFTVHNTQMNEYQDLLLPMPTSVTVKKLEVVGTVRKETVLTPITEVMPSQRAISEQLFVDVVSQDVILPYQENEESPEEMRVFGLPLSVDTLALYYNKDLFDAAGIAQPPETWEAFQKDVVTLTKYADDASVLQSGASLGTEKNVDRAVDIVQMLMLQNGTTMIDEKGRVTFNALPSDAGEGVFPGLDAVRFFTDFANPVKETYTWNAEMPQSIDAFAAGKTAMMLGYSYHLPIIRASSPAMDIGIVQAPQIGGGAKEVNFANYWIETVSKDTEHPNEAWSFLAFATAEENVMSYLNETQKPTALRGLIDEQIEDEVLSPFVSQILTAESWYHGSDVKAMEAAFETLIAEVLSANREGEDAINAAAKIVAQTY